MRVISSPLHLMETSFKTWPIFRTRKRTLKNCYTNKFCHNIVTTQQIPNNTKEKMITFAKYSMSQVIKSNVAPVSDSIVYQFDLGRSSPVLIQVYYCSFHLWLAATSPWYYSASVHQYFHANLLVVTATYKTLGKTSKTQSYILRICQ